MLQQFGRALASASLTDAAFCLKRYVLPSSTVPGLANDQPRSQSSRQPLRREQSARFFSHALSLPACRASTTHTVRSFASAAASGKPADQAAAGSQQAVSEQSSLPTTHNCLQAAASSVTHTACLLLLPPSHRLLQGRRSCWCLEAGALWAVQCARRPSKQGCMWCP